MLSFRLVKRLRDFTVDISEQLGAEALVLIGHSGCGKSTTLKLLSGLLSPDQGTIVLDHRILWSDQAGIDVPPEERNIGYVIQNYALFPHLTITENIEYGISHLSKEERAKRVDGALEFLGLRALGHAKPAMLSGGEQQRVALARALVTRPKLLLLDEPLSALDVSTRSSVRADLKVLLRKLAIPTIVVTHDFEDARVLGDRIAVMDRGRLIQTGTQKEIAERPINSFVAEFTGTNLVKHQEAGGRTALVAFDPWRVEVSDEPGSSGSAAYEWKGIIRDIAWIGGFVRLHIEGEASVLADISIEAFEAAGLQVGNTVYARILPEDARVVSSAVEEESHEQVQEPKYTDNRRQQPAKKWWGLALSLLLIAAFAAIGYRHSSKQAAPPEINMVAFVAANATDPFNDFIQIFQGKHSGVKLQATYAGTQVLRTQLEQGAKADLFLSADLSHIQAVQQEGLIDQYYPVSRNHEVLVVPKNNPAGIHSLQDLGTKPVKLIIGTDTVPIGKYTRTIFDKANKSYGEQFSKSAMAHVVSLETDVKQVLQKVALGEAGAGIVYRTDVTPSFAGKVDVIEIPGPLNVDSVNYIAVPKNAPNPQFGKELLSFMLSPEGQGVFAKYLYEKVK